MAEVTYARANRSFGTIREGEVVEIAEDDARGQAYLASGYLTVVDDSKGAKKVKAGDLEDEQQWDKTVWDGGVTEKAGFDAATIRSNAGQPVTGDSGKGGPLDLKGEVRGEGTTGYHEDGVTPLTQPAPTPKKSSKATEAK
jgi:hypothetical protein